MHRVGSAGNTSTSVCALKEKRLTYLLTDENDTKHCGGVNCLAVLNSTLPNGHNNLFTGSRDGTIKRWAFVEDGATCSATFVSHFDWVNDVVLTGGNTLVSCSSDTTVKVWNCLSDGTCIRTLQQHSDYVTCLASAESNSNIVASGGLGGEVFIWDLEAALSITSKSTDITEDNCSTSINGFGRHLPNTILQPTISSNNISVHTPESRVYAPVAAKGHKESVYALAINDRGTLLVSGGTEKVVRVWDPRTGSKTMKLRGHTDNIRALLLDSTGRYCLSGSSDSMIRLWDLGQQRCVHTYSVHTDSVWALASSSTFSHVYSGGKDLSLYYTDLVTRESSLLCTKEHPILQLSLDEDGIWVATTDYTIRRWPAQVQNPLKVSQKGGSVLTGNLSFSKARDSVEGSTPALVYRELSFGIHGASKIVQHEVLNNKRHVLTKDTYGTVKLWEVTKGVVIENYGEISFEKKKEELFEMVSIPTWFTVDAKSGRLSVHLDTPQCFSAEIYSSDININGKPEDHKINLGRETLKGLLAHWITKRGHNLGFQTPANGNIDPGKEISSLSSTLSRIEVDGIPESDSMVYPPFEFSVACPPVIVTEGSEGGQWRKKITDLDGTEDDRDMPWWVIDCVLNNRLPPRENTKCSFSLHPHEGSTVQILTQGKLSAPRILKIRKIVNYVTEKLALNKTMDDTNDGVTFAPELNPSQNLRPSIEVLCKDQVLLPEMSLFTVCTCIWKKPEDLILSYRLLQDK